MKILYDRGQKEGKHELKHRTIKAYGYELEPIPLPVGDYVLFNDKIEDVIKRKGKRGVAIKKMDLLGTYDICVDTKADCEELYGNLIQSHDRFKDEVSLAANNGIRLIILVENTLGIEDYTEIGKFKNEKRWKSYFVAKRRCERLGKKPPKEPATPTQLKKIMYTMQQKYDGLEFVFCAPQDAGKKVAEILEEGGR